MPKIRELKKTIDSLTYQVLADCFAYSDMHPDSNPEEVSAIISEAVILRNDLISRVNEPMEKNDHKLIRSHFRNIEKDLYSGADKMFNKLSGLPRE